MFTSQPGTLAPPQCARPLSSHPLCELHSSGDSGGSVSLDRTGVESRPMTIPSPGILRPSSEAEAVLSHSTAEGNCCLQQQAAMLGAKSCRPALC